MQKGVSKTQNTGGGGYAEKRQYKKKRKKEKFRGGVCRNGSVLTFTNRPWKYKY